MRSACAILRVATPLLLLPLFCFRCSPGTSDIQDALVITNVNVIDVEAGLRQNQTVYVKDGHILDLGPSTDVSPAPSNTIINGTGKYLIPGLWDAHVHFDYAESLAPSMFALFLGYGVTSVRDTGGRLKKVKAWQDAAGRDSTAAPRVKIAGPLLDGAKNVYDGSSPRLPPLSVGSGSVGEVLAILDDLDETGVDFFKAYEMLSPDQLVAITKRAREKGLKVTGHIPLSMDAITASNAGMNCMEHLRNLELSCAANADELLERRRIMLALNEDIGGSVLRSRIHAAQRTEAMARQDSTKTAEVLRVLAANNTWQVPTLALNTFRNRMYVSRPDFQESVKYLPDSLSQYWLDGMKALGTQTFSATAKASGTWSMSMIKPLHDAGVEMMAGTDCPIAYLTPGYSLHEELAVLVESGLTPLEALKTATLNPARFFGMEETLGLIEKGYLADLVLLDANPLEDIRNTTKIRAMVRAGRYYSRRELDALLAGAKQAGK